MQNASERKASRRGLPSKWYAHCEADFTLKNSRSGRGRLAAAPVERTCSTGGSASPDPDTAAGAPGVQGGGVEDE